MSFNEFTTHDDGAATLKRQTKTSFWHTGAQENKHGTKSTPASYCGQVDGNRCKIGGKGRIVAVLPPLPMNEPKGSLHCYLSSVIVAVATVIVAVGVNFVLFTAVLLLVLLGCVFHIIFTAALHFTGY